MEPRMTIISIHTHTHNSYLLQRCFDIMFLTFSIDFPTLKQVGQLPLFRILDRNHDVDHCRDICHMRRCHIPDLSATHQLSMTCGQMGKFRAILLQKGRLLAQRKEIRVPALASLLDAGSLGSLPWRDPHGSLPANSRPRQ